MSSAPCSKMFTSLNTDLQLKFQFSLNDISSNMRKASNLYQVFSVETVNTQNWCLSLREH
jgi:hypothetical protein